MHNYRYINEDKAMGRGDIGWHVVDSEVGSESWVFEGNYGGWEI